MLFFQTQFMIDLIKYKIIAPLQVRNHCQLYFLRKKQCCEKRALSWASHYVEGSLSLEGAMCLSLFLFLCVCLITPMKMMDRQRQIQAVMESVGEELSRYAYVEYCFRTPEDNQIELNRADEAEAGSLLAAGYAAAKILGRIDGSWIESASFEGTGIGPDDMVYISLKYRMRLPFTVLGLRSIPVQQICSRRMWTGADGNRFETGGEAGDDGEEIVYIGKNPTRYHRQRTCHYLYNNLEAISPGQIDSLRNQSGARYQPCKSCGASPGAATVYVMPWGTSYHTAATCKAIIAYVQAVPLSQVEHLGECSYCKGR